MRHVELARQAARDIRQISHSQGLDRLEKALFDELSADPAPENLDIKTLQGRKPWLRMRVGDWRLIYRPLTQEELLECREGEETEGFLVARIIHRRDLDRTLRTLEL